MAQLIIKKGREKSLLRFHPWVFSGAVDKIHGEPEAGDTIEVRSSDKKLLGLAAYSPESQIVARVWSFDPADEINEDFFHTKIQSAYQKRLALGINQQSNAFRVIASESDGLPGLIVDLYNNTFVFQLLSQGTERWREAIINSLKAIKPDAEIVERSDVNVRKKEGLAQRKDWIKSEAKQSDITITENGYTLDVDIWNGHKTGFYLDQRDSRLAVQKYVEGKTVLNCFSYTGGFSISALKAGAEKVINIDESQPALDIALKNAEDNGLDVSKLENINGDVFKKLRTFRDGAKQFDVIILDPPKFADNKSQLNRACRGYKDINLLAMKLLKPGGVLITFSCSGLISPDLFQKTVAGAAADAGKQMQIVERLNQAPDHPTSIHFPEGHYLKGLVCLMEG